MFTTRRDSHIVLRNGEKIDLKDFFDVYYPKLTSFASTFIVNLTVCEDIVQDVFVVIWQKQNDFLNFYAVKSFFYTAVRNFCLDYLKHCKVEEKYRNKNKLEVHDQDSFLEEVIRKEAYNEIYTQISKLPEMGKKVLLLALRENSNEEIAQELNISINTVKTHKARSYKVLRQNLNELILLFFPFCKRFTHH